EAEQRLQTVAARQLWPIETLVVWGDPTTEICRIAEQSALWAGYGAGSTYSIVSPLHPDHPIVGIPLVYSPRNVAAPIATSMIASLTSSSSPQTVQRYKYSSGGGPKGMSDRQST